MMVDITRLAGSSVSPGIPVQVEHMNETGYSISQDLPRYAVSVEAEHPHKLVDSGWQAQIHFTCQRRYMDIPLVLHSLIKGSVDNLSAISDNSSNSLQNTAPSVPLQCCDNALIEQLHTIILW